MTDIGAPPSSTPPAPKPTATQPVTPAASTGRDGGQQATPQTTTTSTTPQQGAAETPAVRLGAGAGAAASIASGSELRAIVIGRSAEGQPLIQSPAGTFTLSSKLALRLNSELVLRLNVGGANPRAALLTVNGLPQRPPPEVTLLSARTAATTAAPPASATLAANIARPLFAGLGAVVVPIRGPGLSPGPNTSLNQPLGSTPGAPQNGLQLTPATPLVLRLAGLHAPTAVGGTTSASPAGAPATASSGPQTGPTGQPATTPTTAPAAAQAATATTPSPNLAAGALARPAVPLLGGPNLEAVVTGTTGDGALLVRTPIGNLALDVRAALAVGSRLSLEVVPGRPPTTLPPALASALTDGGRTMAMPATTGSNAPPVLASDVVRQFAQTWPALKEALSVIQAADAGGAQHIVNNVIPSATPQLASAILFFLTALRGG